MKKRLLTLIIASLSLFGLTGCSSGGTNGEGNVNANSSEIYTAIRGNEYVEKGWSYINSGLYDSAISQFNKVLESSPTEQEKADANNGIGWAKSFSPEGKLKDGIKWFTLAKDLNDDAKVGLASAYLQQASKSDMEEVIEILAVELGKNNPTFIFTPTRPIGVTNAEVHAMLGYAYAVVEDNENAYMQIEHAKTLEPNYLTTELGQMIAATEFLMN